MFPITIFFILFFFVLVLGFAHRKGYDIGGILAIVCVVAVEAVEFYTFCMLFPGNSMAGSTFSVASGYIGPQVTPTSCYDMPAILPMAYARIHVPLGEMARTLAAYPAATYTPATAPIMEVSTASQQEMPHWATSFEATPTPTHTVVGGSRDISALSRIPWRAAIVVLGLASIYTLTIGVWMWKARYQEMAMSCPRREIYMVGAAFPAPSRNTANTTASLSIGSGSRRNSIASDSGLASPGWGISKFGPYRIVWVEADNTGYQDYCTVTIDSLINATSTMILELQVAADTQITALSPPARTNRTLRGIGAATRILGHSNHSPRARNAQHRKRRYR